MMCKNSLIIVSSILTKIILIRRTELISFGRHLVLNSCSWKKKEEGKKAINHDYEFRRKKKQIKILDVKTNATLLFLFNSWNIPLGPMIRDPPPPYVSVGCPPCYSLAFSTLTHARRGLRVRKPGLRFNEPGPQGEKNNYLSRRRGEESPTPPRLFPCLYLFLCFRGRTVCFCGCFAVSLAPSLHGRGDKWWVTQRAGGQTPCPNYLSVFSLFSASFSLSPISSSFLYFFYACKSLSFLLPCPPSLPHFHPSISHLV